MRALTTDEVGVVGGMRELTAEEIEMVGGGQPLVWGLFWVADVMAAQYLVDTIGGGSQYTRNIDNFFSGMVHRSYPGDWMMN